MELIRDFTKLTKSDAGIAGGKGASLGEMTRAGIPVPPGFVVLSSAFERFLKETDLVQEIDAILHKVNHKEIHTVEAASEQIRELILNAEMPKDIAGLIDKSFRQLKAKYVAVRSSATAEDGKDHAWAGQLESHLNTTEKDVLTKVKLCWSSLFTPRAIFYRFEKGLHSTKISVAVVVQKMVESEVSGIAFSVHPVTEDYNQLIIEAGFGLGEAIVSGSVTPDSYVVEKEPRNILDINVSTQDRGLYRSENYSAEHGNNEWVNIPEPRASSQVLTKEQILELSEIILNIEKHYGFPCDIEWAYEKGKFYIVQSRPITTLKTKDHLTALKIPGAFAELLQNNIPFHCSVRYPKIPLIYVDASLSSYIDNPLHKLADTKSDPAAIMYMDQEFSYWTYLQSLPVVSNSKSIDIIESDVIEHIPNYEKTLKDILKKDIEKISKNEVKKLLLETDRVSVEIYRRFTFFIDESFRTEDQAKIKKLQEVRMMLDHLVVNYLFKAYDHIITILTKKFQFDLGVVRCATSAEIIDLINDKLADSDSLKGRAIMYILRKNKIQIVYGKEARYIYDNLLSHDPDKALVSDSQKSGQLRGLIGHSGTAKGHVRKISPSDYHNKEKLESLINDKDFVLVAPMTVPELVPYFKHAVAFVTDEGGITCHAAIIAREMNKPCITGTRIASQVLKDGDMVEVDADKGIVRIIK